MSNPGVRVRNVAVTVLVVEDEVLVRTVAIAHLQDCGFSVLEASSGEAARILVRKTPAIAVVFSDIQMPGGIDGLDLARWLVNECPSVKILLTSGRTVPEGETAWRFLAKPYTMRQLEEKVGALLGG